MADYNEIVEQFIHAHPDAARFIVEDEYTRGAAEAAEDGAILFRDLARLHRPCATYHDLALHKANLNIIQEEIVDYYGAAQWYSYYVGVKLNDVDAIGEAIEMSASLEGYPVLSEQLMSEYEIEAINEALEGWLIDEVLRAGGIVFDDLRDYIADRADDIGVPSGCYIHNTLATRIEEKCRYYGELYVSDDDACEIVDDVLDSLWEPFGRVESARDALEAADLPPEIAGSLLELDARIGLMLLSWNLEIVGFDEVVAMVESEVSHALGIDPRDLPRLRHAPSVRADIVATFNG